MTWNGRTIAIETFEDFDRELAPRRRRDPRSPGLPGRGVRPLPPRMSGTEEEIAAAWDDPHGEEADG